MFKVSMTDMAITFLQHLPLFQSRVCFIFSSYVKKLTLDKMAVVSRMSLLTVCIEKLTGDRMSLVDKYVHAVNSILMGALTKIF